MSDELTRGEAHDLVDEALAASEADAGEAIKALCIHWIGHAEFDGTIEETADVLHEYVDDAAFNGDDERNTGPKDSDPTGLTAP